MGQQNAWQRSARPRTATLKPVAGRAGMAPVAVSRAPDTPNSVSAAFARRPARRLAALGHVPAGALPRTARIAPVIVPSLSSAVFIELIGRMRTGAGGRRLPASARQHPLRPRPRRRAGVDPTGLVAGLRQAGRAGALLRGCNRPVAEVTEAGPFHLKPGVLTERHLAGRGYRRIGLPGDRPGAEHRARRRHRGLDRVLAGTGFDRRPPLRHPDGASLDAGGRGLLAGLDRAPGPDTLFFANGDLAVGALRRGARDGIANPGRIAVAGLGLPRHRRPDRPGADRRRFAARRLLARVAGSPAGSAGGMSAAGWRCGKAPGTVNVVHGRVAARDGPQGPRDPGA